MVRETDPFEKLLNEFLKENPEPVSVGELRGMRASSRRGKYKQLADRLGGTTLFARTPHPWSVRRIDRLSPCRIPGLPTFQMRRIIDLEDGRCVATGTAEVVPVERGKPGARSRDEFCIVVARPMPPRDDPPPPDELSLERLAWEYHRDDVCLDPKDVKVVAMGIPQFLERILTARGRYFFDDPEFVPDAQLEVGE